MKKLYILGFLLLLLVVAWIALVNHINTRTTSMKVQISAAVDEVLFYLEGHPDQLITSIQTHGKDTSAVVVLRNTSSNDLLFTGSPSNYYFISKKANEIFHSNRVCCSTSITNQTGSITIRDLHEYQQFHP